MTKVMRSIFNFFFVMTKVTAPESRLPFLESSGILKVKIPYFCQRDLHNRLFFAISALGTTSKKIVKRIFRNLSFQRWFHETSAVLPFVPRIHPFRKSSEAIYSVDDGFGT